MKVKKDKYFKVVTSEQGDSADILLYGVIGQDFWWDENLEEESITDLAFYREFKRLEAKYDRINIRINSPGGSVLHGDAIVSLITQSPKEIHTYNDGLAASMAADIWVAGKTRHMSINAKLMIHCVSTIAIGNAQDMRDEADRLDKFDQSSIAFFAKATGMSEEEVKNQFYDYRDHWMTAQDVLDIGLIDRVEEYEVEMPVASDSKSYQELVLSYMDQTAETQPEERKSFFHNMLDFARFAIGQKSVQNAEKVDINQFKKSLENGELDLAEVKAHVDSLTENGGGTSSQEEDETITALTNQVGDLETKLNQLTEKLEALQAAPAAPPTQAPATDPNEVEKTADQKHLDEYNKQLAEAASGKMNPFWGAQ
jgi:ATP-dependent Clp protease protease subunit